jgi:hypothetical protein
MWHVLRIRREGVDISVPRAYDSAFVKDKDGLAEGLKLERMLVCGDMYPVVVEAKKRGLV